MTDFDPGFHAKDRWYFARLDDGSVRLMAPDSLGPGASQVVTLDGPTWASAVAHVSHKGGTSETFDAAILFHGGPVQNVAGEPVGPLVTDPVTGEEFEVNVGDYEQ